MTLQAFAGQFGARYLLRFDDLCPTMNWGIWEQIETILQRSDAQPILAVIPDNHDPALMRDPAAEHFWERVRSWQRRGWTIGLHGYQHRYYSASSGLLGLNRRSEFAGLPEAAQREKLAAALAVFTQQGVRPDLWVAPAHSFDATTVHLLHQHGLKIISDGFSWRPYLDADMVWIPQQLWRFRSVPCGTWTVCLHHNHWTEQDLVIFASELTQRREQLIGVAELLSRPIAQRSLPDRIFFGLFLTLLRLRRGRTGAVAPHLPPEVG